MLGTAVNRWISCNLDGTFVVYLHNYWTGDRWNFSTSEHNFWSHNASLVASEMAMYSASVLDKLTVICN